MSKTTSLVDVTDVMRQDAADVFAQAREKYADELRTYQEGIRRLAAGEGKLPRDEADRLLEACRALDIPPSKMDDDIGVILEYDRLVADIASIHARNAAKVEPIPRLEAEVQAMQNAYMRVRHECEELLSTAEAKVTAARRALHDVQRVPLEKAEEKERGVLKIEDRSRHLFRLVEPEALKQIVRPDRRGVFG